MPPDRRQGRVGQPAQPGVGPFPETNAEHHGAAEEADAPGDHRHRRRGRRKTEARDARPMREGRKDREVANGDEQLAGRHRRRSFMCSCIGREAKVSGEQPGSGTPGRNAWPDRAGPSARHRHTKSRAARSSEGRSTVRRPGGSAERRSERTERDHQANPAGYHTNRYGCDHPAGPPVGDIEPPTYAYAEISRPLTLMIVAVMIATTASSPCATASARHTVMVRPARTTRP